MSIMVSAFLAILPIFLLIGVGMIADKCRFLPDNLSSMLSAYVLRLALPILLLRIIGSADLGDLARGDFWFALLLAQVVVYLMGYLGDLTFARRGKGPAAVTALGCSCCNAAFLGLPIIASLLPNNPEALLAAGIATVTPSISMVPGQVTLEFLRQKEQQSAQVGIGTLLIRAFLHNPIFMGLLSGVVLCLSGIGLWAPLDRTAELIGQTCGPCALVALGLDMRSRMGVAMRAEAHAFRVPLGVLLVKLVIHPLLAWLLLAVCGVSGLWLAVGVIMAGTATGVAVYMMADYYQTVPEEGALSVVLTNGLNLFTLSIFAFIFRLMGAI